MSTTRIVKESTINGRLVRQEIEYAGAPRDRDLERIHVALLGVEVELPELPPPGEVFDMRDAVLPRPEVMEFAIAMEKALRANDAEKGDSWKHVAHDDLLLGLAAEVRELGLACEQQRSMSTVQLEAVDVANFAMFLYFRAEQG